MKEAGESGTSDSGEANTASGAFEEAVGKHRLKSIPVNEILHMEHNIIWFVWFNTRSFTWCIISFGITCHIRHISHGEPPASYHSEPLAEACEQIPPRRQEQTGRNPFHVQKGEMESFGKQDFLVKILRPSKCQLVGPTSMSEKRRWPRTTSSSCRPIVSIICVRVSITRQ